MFSLTKKERVGVIRFIEISWLVEKKKRRYANMALELKSGNYVINFKLHDKS